jgi:EAL and modified HD-GYP domain-containing signal transduction protein
MAPNGNAHSQTEILDHSGAGEVRYIARQPILDAQGEVHAYALLFDTASNGLIEGRGRDAARAIVDDAVLIGLDRLAGGLPAFIRCTSEALIEQLVTVLPPAITVLSIPETVKVSPHVVDACRELKASGFRIALVDYTGAGDTHPLLELADYIKVDRGRLDATARLRLRLRMKASKIQAIAERVDTQEDHRSALEEGYSFFQGLYFCYPELIQSTHIPANRAFHMEILRLLQSDPLDLKKVSRAVMRDAALVLRLLRLVNSPICAIRQEVNSIETAIMILGETTFRRIANLAILRELNSGQPAELLHMALVRARFCELSAPHCGQDASEQYLLGLLSLLPAMLRCPMETLAAEMPLRSEIRHALLGAPVPERCLLTWIEAHERDLHHDCIATSKTWNLNEQKLNQFYVDALMWDAATPRNFN